VYPGTVTMGRQWQPCSAQNRRATHKQRRRGWSKTYAQQQVVIFRCRIPTYYICKFWYKTLQVLKI